MEKVDYLSEEELINIGRQIGEAFVAEHEETASQVIHQMYLHREDILLVLTKSQGSKYENIADRFIDSAEKHYRLMADAMVKHHPKAKIDDKFIHWLAHEQIDTFIFMISHIETEQEALPFINQAVTYMMSEWYVFVKVAKD